MSQISDPRTRIQSRISFLRKRIKNDELEIMSLENDLKKLSDEEAVDGESSLSQDEVIQESDVDEEREADQESSLSHDEGAQEDQHSQQAGFVLDRNVNRRSHVGPSQRLPWTDAEVGFVTDWIRSNPYSPVRALYNTIMQSPSAKSIFAFRHISSVDRLDYMYKKVHKTLGVRK